MRRLIPVALVTLALSACTTTAPEPRIEVREVKVVVPIPCNPDPRPKKPALPDTDAALAVVPTVFAAVKLFKAGRALRDAYIGELEAALGGKSVV